MFLALPSILLWPRALRIVCAPHLSSYTLIGPSVQQSRMSRSGMSRRVALWVVWNSSNKHSRKGHDFEDLDSRGSRRGGSKSLFQKCSPSLQRALVVLFSSVVVCARVHKSPLVVGLTEEREHTQHRAIAMYCMTVALRCCLVESHSVVCEGAGATGADAGPYRRLCVATRPV